MSEQPKDLRKLCILNAKETETDDQIRNVCEEFAQLIAFNRPPNNKRLAFPLFKSPSDAALAKEGLLAKGYHVDYAKAKPSNSNGGGGSAMGGDRNQRERSEFRSTQNLNGGGGSENGDSDDTHGINQANSIDNRPYGKCIRCEDKAFYNCGRCGDFYCSEECQASDWLKHKQNCFPMPKLLPSKSQQNLLLGKSMEKLKLNEAPAVNTDTADGHEVTPTRKTTVQIRSLKEIESEDVKPIIKPSDTVETEASKPAPAEAAPAKSAASKVAVHDDTKNAKAASDNSFRTSVSPRHKIILSNYGDSAQSSTTAINRTGSESIPNGSNVWITHVRNYQSVYIRSEADNDGYLKLMQDVATAALTAPSLKTYPYPKEDYVLAPFDGLYYRGYVLACNENAGQVRIGYIDFGNSQDVPFSTLKVLPTELKERPRGAFIVNLKGLKDEPEPKEVIAMKEYLESISENGDGLLLKVTGTRAQIEANDIVELFEVISNCSVNDKLNSMVQKRYYLSDLTQKVLKVDPANLPVLMALDTTRVADNIMTCLVKDDVNVFMEGDEHTQRYGESAKNAPAYKPKQKELCVVRIKETEGYFWYRCIYQTELVDERAQVYCIDYGKVDTVRQNNIRAMTSGLEHEITSIVCFIKNGKSISDEKRIKYFNDQPEFKPLGIEYDQKTHQHVVTVDFSEVE